MYIHVYIYIYINYIKYISFYIIIMYISEQKVPKNNACSERWRTRASSRALSRGMPCRFLGRKNCQLNWLEQFVWSICLIIFVMKNRKSDGTWTNMSNLRNDTREMYVVSHIGLVVKSVFCGIQLCCVICLFGLPLMSFKIYSFGWDHAPKPRPFETQLNQLSAWWMLTTCERTQRIDRTYIYIISQQLPPRAA